VCVSLSLFADVVHALQRMWVKEKDFLKQRPTGDHWEREKRGRAWWISVNISMHAIAAACCYGSATVKAMIDDKTGAYVAGSVRAGRPTRLSDEQQDFIADVMTMYLLVQQKKPTPSELGVFIVTQLEDAEWTDRNGARAITWGTKIWERFFLHHPEFTVGNLRLQELKRLLAVNTETMRYFEILIRTAMASATHETNLPFRMFINEDEIGNHGTGDMGKLTSRKVVTLTTQRQMGTPKHADRTTRSALDASDSWGNNLPSVYILAGSVPKGQQYAHISNQLAVEIRTAVGGDTTAEEWKNRIVCTTSGMSNTEVYENVFVKHSLIPHLQKHLVGANGKLKGLALNIKDNHFSHMMSSLSSELTKELDAVGLVALTGPSNASSTTNVCDAATFGRRSSRWRAHVRDGDISLLTHAKYVQGWEKVRNADGLHHIRKDWELSGYPSDDPGPQGHLPGSVSIVSTVDPVRLALGDDMLAKKRHKVAVETQLRKNESVTASLKDAVGLGRKRQDILEMNSLRTALQGEHVVLQDIDTGKDLPRDHVTRILENLSDVRLQQNQQPVSTNGVLTYFPGKKPDGSRQVQIRWKEIKEEKKEERDAAKAITDAKQKRKAQELERKTMIMTGSVDVERVAVNNCWATFTLQELNQIITAVNTRITNQSDGYKDANRLTKGGKKCQKICRLQDFFEAHSDIIQGARPDPFWKTYSDNESDEDEDEHEDEGHGDKEEEQEDEHGVAQMVHGVELEESVSTRLMRKCAFLDVMLADSSPPISTKSTKQEAGRVVAWHHVRHASVLRIKGGFLRDHITRGEEFSDIDSDIKTHAHQTVHTYLEELAPQLGARVDVNRKKKGSVAETVVLRSTDGRWGIDTKGCEITLEVDLATASSAARVRQEPGVNNTAGNTSMSCEDGVVTMTSTVTRSGRGVELLDMESQVDLTLKKQFVAYYDPRTKVGKQQSKKLLDRGWTEVVHLDKNSTPVEFWTRPRVQVNAQVRDEAQPLAMDVESAAAAAESAANPGTASAGAGKRRSATPRRTNKDTLKRRRTSGTTDADVEMKEAAAKWCWLSGCMDAHGEEDMIECTSQTCARKWFHFKCIFQREDMSTSAEQTSFRQAVNSLNWACGGGLGSKRCGHTGS
jgi:hypothetical protein